MIDKEEKILRKHLDNDQMVILIQHDLLHLVAMAMRMYKNEDKLVEKLNIDDVSNQRELLIDFLNKKEYCDYVEIAEESFEYEVDEYLGNL